MRHHGSRALLIACLSLLLMSPVALAQIQPTLTIDPVQGMPGTTVALAGDGWPDTDQRFIFVTWSFDGRRMEARDLMINNGVLSGTAVIPNDATGDPSDVVVCVPSSDDVVQQYCASAEFTVIPIVTIQPDRGAAGSEVRATGSGFPVRTPPQWDLLWSDDGSTIGSAEVDQEGRLTGSGVIPVTASEGQSVIQVCQEEDCHSVEPLFEVVGPTVLVDPDVVRAGDSFEVTGQNWCCQGDQGTIVDLASGESWGTVAVGGDGGLTGTAVVSDGVDPGERTLEICVSERCQFVTFVVEPTPPETTTTTTIIEPRCALREGSLATEPSSGAPGTDVRIVMTGADQLPEDCVVRVNLGGHTLGEERIFPEEQSTLTAVIPTDMAPGSVEMLAIDAATGSPLGSAVFEVNGPVTLWPWIAAGGALVLLGLMRALRPRPGPPLDGDGPAQPAGPLPVVPARWIEARLFVRENGTETPVAFFRAGASHRIEVEVGPADITGAEVDPQTLRVILTEPDLLGAPAGGEVAIQDQGASTSISFNIDVAPGTASVNARLLLTDGNRVVHTARLPGTVGDPPPAQPDNVAVLETVVRAVTAPGARPGVTAGIVVDGGRFPIVTQVTGSQPARLIRIPQAGAGAIERIRSRLGEIVDAPEDFAGLDREATRELLVYLAHHGRLLRSSLVNDFLGEELAASPSMQVVSAAPDAYLPLELAYDFPAPDEDATMCPQAGDTLRAIDPNIACPGPHDQTIVCPVGFWGVTKVIERHAFQSADDLPDGFLVRSQPVTNRSRIPLSRGVLVGASHRVSAHDPDALGRLLARIEAAAPGTAVVDAWEAWDREVATHGQDVLVLLPHTVYSDRLGVYGLEIGADDQRWMGNMDNTVPDTPVVVSLLGCETAVAGRVSYEQFPGNLRIAGAEIIIATLTEVLGRHAAPLAERLVTLMLESRAARPRRLGEVVMALRRQLLAEGLPVVLALAVYGDADWMVGGE